MEDEAQSQGTYWMGVDTGSAFHVVVLKHESGDTDGDGLRQVRLVHLAVCHDFSDLDAIMKRFRIFRCVIDGLPETHATRDFAKRHRGHVFMCFFNEHQRGEMKWDREAHTVQVNRTEALDASRAAVRDKKVILPRRLPSRRDVRPAHGVRRQGAR